MSLGPFDLLFEFLRDLANGNLHYAWLIILLLMVASLEIGFRIGRFAAARHQPNDAEKSAVNFSSAGMVGLLAFLLGISLSMASGRFEQRRDSVLAEANAIGTSWLRAELAGATERDSLRRLLREYTEVRIAAVRGGADTAEADRLNRRTNELQAEIWRLAAGVAERAPTPISGLLLASLNETFDLALTNRRNFSSHVPTYVIRLLLTVSILAVGAVGYGFGIAGTRQFAVSLMLLAAWTLAIVLIVDVDRPQAGEVRVTPAPLVWTLEGFGPAQ